jgi:hypothetical protein
VVRASVKAAAPARKASQPGLKVGITSGDGAAAQHEQCVPPQLESRGILKGVGEASSHLGGHGS